MLSAVLDKVLKRLGTRIILWKKPGTRRSRIYIVVKRASRR
jgi:hypothetical protein